MHTLRIENVDKVRDKKQFVRRAHFFKKLVHNRFMNTYSLLSHDQFQISISSRVMLSFYAKFSSQTVVTFHFIANVLKICSK